MSLNQAFLGFAQVGIVTTNVDAENQCLINHKCVYGALNRHFCQADVTTSAFLSAVVCMSCFAYSNLFFCRAMGHFVKFLFSWVGFASSFKNFGLCGCLCGF
jgi:hypothetical protein